MSMSFELSHPLVVISTSAGRSITPGEAHDQELLKGQYCQPEALTYHTMLARLCF